MKDFEKIVKSLERCNAGANKCDGCAYNDPLYAPSCGKCLVNDAIKLLKEMKTQLDAVKKPDPEACATNYEAECRRLEKELCKLNDALCRVTMDYERACADRAEMQSELDSLRAVRATAEAFLGRKIEAI